MKGSPFLSKMVYTSGKSLDFGAQPSRFTAYICGPLIKILKFYLSLLQGWKSHPLTKRSTQNSENKPPNFKRTKGPIHWFFFFIRTFFIRTSRLRLTKILRISPAEYSPRGLTFGNDPQIQNKPNLSHVRFL